jgi:hypothetical protein
MLELSCTNPSVMRQENMAVSPAALGKKNGCAGEDQKQFTRPTEILQMLTINFTSVVCLLLLPLFLLHHVSYDKNVM